MFFVVGRGRSGTTLLSAMLDADPRLFVAPESLFVMNAFRRYDRCRWSSTTRRRFLRDLWREERMRRWRIDPGELSELLAEQEPEAGLARICATVYLASARAHGRPEPQLLGDKNPLYSLFVPELLRLFPKARFLHLVRDYRDNILSFRNVPFDLSSAGALAYRWRRYNQAILDALAGDEDRIFTVRFEDLVRQPSELMARIYGFLGVEVSAARPQVSRARGEASLPWHRNLSRPIDPSLIGKGQRGLSADLVAQADLVCQPLGRRFGYPPASNRRAIGTRLRALPGVAMGCGFTAAERMLFRLPLEVRTSAIRTYRLATGNKIT